MVICIGQVVHQPSAAAHGCSLFPPRPHRKKAVRLKGGDKYNLMSGIPTGKPVITSIPISPIFYERAGVVDAFVEASSKQ